MVRFVRGGRGPGRRWEVVGVLAWRDGPVCVCYRSVCPNVCPGVCSQVFRAICVLCERGVTRVGGPRTLGGGEPGGPGLLCAVYAFTQSRVRASSVESDDERSRIRGLLTA